VCLHDVWWACGIRIEREQDLVDTGSRVGRHQSVAHVDAIAVCHDSDRTEAR
jgi:hypothetical protein